MTETLQKNLGKFPKTFKDKDLILNKFVKNKMVSLDVFTVKDDNINLDNISSKIEEFTETRYYLVDDLSQPYFIRLTLADILDNNISSVDPTLMEDSDTFELSESIKDILKKNNIHIRKDEFESKDQDKNDE